MPQNNKQKSKQKRRMRPKKRVQNRKATGNFKLKVHLVSAFSVNAGGTR